MIAISAALAIMGAVQVVIYERPLIEVIIGGLAAIAVIKLIGDLKMINIRLDNIEKELEKRI